MKLKNLLPASLLLLLLGACENKNETIRDEDVVVADRAASADDAINAWSQAWANNDPEAVEEMTADDVVLVLNGSRSMQDSLSSWIQQSASNIRDLQMEALTSQTYDSIAYETGIYTHRYKGEDTTAYGGAYTFIWERAPNRTGWEVKVINISEDTMPVRDTLSQ